MTPLANNNSASAEYEIKRISLWVAIASVLQISESLIPHPVPGIRLGLANMVTLVIMVNYSFSAALQVAVLRTLVSSFIMGTFLSPGFMLSFASALNSTLSMGLLYRLSRSNTSVYFSLFGIGVLGAFIHNLTQLVLAYLLLIRHTAVFLLLPWLSIGAVLMGLIAATIARRISQKMRIPTKTEWYDTTHVTKEPAFHVKDYFPGNSFIHRLRPQVKILGLLLTALIIFLFADLRFYLLITGGIILMVMVSNVSLIRVFRKLKNLSFLIVISFLFPVLFDHGHENAVPLGVLPFTQEALLAGTLFSIRIVILVMMASLLVQTTSPAEMIDGLKKTISPLRAVGMDPDKLGKIIALSWQWVPELWQEIRGIMKGLLTKKEKRFSVIMHSLTDFLVFLFQKRHP